jgi:hypothetical protein
MFSHVHVIKCWVTSNATQAFCSRPCCQGTGLQYIWVLPPPAYLTAPATFLMWQFGEMCMLESGNCDLTPYFTWPKCVLGQAGLRSPLPLSAPFGLDTE